MAKILKFESFQPAFPTLERIKQTLDTYSFMIPNPQTEKLISTPLFIVNNDYGDFNAWVKALISKSQIMPDYAHEYGFGSNVEERNNQSVLTSTRIYLQKYQLSGKEFWQIIYQETVKKLDNSLEVLEVNETETVAFYSVADLEVIYKMMQIGDAIIRSDYSQLGFFEKLEDNVIVKQFTNVNTWEGEGQQEAIKWFNRLFKVLGIPEEDCRTCKTVNHICNYFSNYLAQHDIDFETKKGYVLENGQRILNSLWFYIQVTPEQHNIFYMPEQHPDFDQFGFFEKFEGEDFVITKHFDVDAGETFVDYRQAVQFFDQLCEQLGIKWEKDQEIFFFNNRDVIEYFAPLLNQHGVQTKFYPFETYEVVIKIPKWMWEKANLRSKEEEFKNLGFFEAHDPKDFHIVKQNFWFKDDWFDLYDEALNWFKKFFEEIGISYDESNRYEDIADVVNYFTAELEEHDVLVFESMVNTEDGGYFELEFWVPLYLWKKGQLKHSEDEFRDFGFFEDVQNTHIWEIQFHAHQKEFHNPERIIDKFEEIFRFLNIPFEADHFDQWDSSHDVLDYYLYQLQRNGINSSYDFKKDGMGGIYYEIEIYVPLDLWHKSQSREQNPDFKEFGFFENYSQFRQLTWLELAQVRNEYALDYFLESISGQKWYTQGMSWLPEAYDDWYPFIYVTQNSENQWNVHFRIYIEGKDVDKMDYDRTVPVNPKDYIDYAMLEREYRNMLKKYDLKEENPDYDQFGFFESYQQPELTWTELRKNQDLMAHFLEKISGQKWYTGAMDWFLYQQPEIFPAVFWVGTHLKICIYNKSQYQKLFETELEIHADKKVDWDLIAKKFNEALNWVRAKEHNPNFDQFGFFEKIKSFEDFV